MLNEFVVEREKVRLRQEEVTRETRRLWSSALPRKHFGSMAT